MVGWLQDSIRAVDLLTSRPEVDSHRIGAMGCSGGGIDHIHPTIIPLTQQRLLIQLIGTSAVLPQQLRL